MSDSRKTELCSGDCGKVMLKEDMNLSCYNHWYCKDCMFTFVAEQERRSRGDVDMVGGDDPCDYE